MISNPKKRWDNFCEEGLPFGIFCGSAMIVLSLWFVWYFSDPFIEEFHISNWQPTDCTIISSQIDENRLEIKYRYIRESVPFENDRYQYGWDSDDHLLASEVKDLSERYRPGSRAVCYVDPENPHQAVLTRKDPLLSLFFAIPVYLFIVGARQLYLGIGRFRTIDLSGHTTCDIANVHFETSGRKGTGSKIWGWLTGFGLFIGFLLNFPLMFLISVFLYLAAGAIGKQLKDMRIKLIKMELNVGENATARGLSGRNVHFTFPEKAVLVISLVIYLVLMGFIATYNMSKDPFALFGVIFGGLWLGFFMFTVVWMIISFMHGYHYIALEEEKKEKVVLAFDLPLWSLLVSNLIVIAWAVAERWSLYMLLWVYWGQSLCIGFFLLTKALTAKGIVNDSGVPVSRHKKIAKAIGFVFVYLLFHCGYVIFLETTFAVVEPAAGFLWVIVSAVGIFFVQQMIAFVYDAVTNSNRTNIDNLIETAGLRIMPMHLTLMGVGFLSGMAGFSVNSPVMLVLFLGLRAFADVGMSLYTRKGFSKKMDGIFEEQTPDTFDITTGTCNEPAENDREPCDCHKTDCLKGWAAHDYAKSHLKARQINDFGRQVEYVCPFTGQRWLMDFREETEAHQVSNSRLRKLDKDAV